MDVIPVGIFDFSGHEIASENGKFLLEEARNYRVLVTRHEQSDAWLDALPLTQEKNGEFILNIGHWVGDSELRVTISGVLHTIPISVRPRAEKLSESVWAAMLREIEEWLPSATLGGEGGLHGSVGKIGISAPLLVEAIVPLLSFFEKALQAMINQPRQLDRTIWIEQNLFNVRDLGRNAMTWIVRHPDTGCWLDPWKAVELGGNGPKIPIRNTIDSVDHPANRYIAWLLFRIIKKFEIAIDCLNKLAKSLGGSIETQNWCEARSRRLDMWLERMKKILQNSWLGKIERRPAGESALLTVLDDPIYARVHSLGRLFLSPLFTLANNENNLGAAVKPSFSIYELWCFLSLFRNLKNHLKNWTWTGHSLVKLLSLTGTGGGASFSAKSPSGDQVLSILFNPTFVGFHVHKNEDRWSLSGERRPDFVISFKETGKEGAWLFLDAKYRVGRSNLEDAFSSVHIYRDSLRYEEFGGQCKAGGLIIPSKTIDSAKWFSQDFRDNYHTSVWELRPGRESGDEMAEWLISTLVTTNS